MCHVEYELGKMAFEGHEYSKALKYLRPLAERGHAKAQYLLGYMHAEGRGTVKDPDLAKRWLTAATRQGLDDIHGELGDLCIRDATTPGLGCRDVVALRRDAQAGDMESQLEFGFRLARGHGTDHDDAQSVRWFRKATEHDSPEAFAALGFMYTDGRGVERDDAEAARCFRRAADRGLSASQAALGFMYASGRGVPHDFVQAYMWLSVSESPRTGSVSDRLAKIRAHMTKIEIAKAEDLATHWEKRQ